MPTRALSMRKIRELIRLKYQARLSHEQIAGALSISKGVVAKYVARIERAGLELKELLVSVLKHRSQVDSSHRRSLHRHSRTRVCRLHCVGS